MTADTLAQTKSLIETGMAAGLHVGAQVYVSLKGEVIADFAVGFARPGVGMQTDTLMLWLSSGKPIAAVAVAQLWERGLLDLDDRVARHIPEFAVRGKEAITIRHLVTHTGGFRGLTGDWENQPWENVVAAVCDARLEPGWSPGRKAGYHLGTSWYILGELVRRLDGRSFERYVHEVIFQPLGMDDSWVGLPAERNRAYGDRIGLMHRTDGSEPRAEHPLNSESAAAQCRPGSNTRGPIRQLGFFYEAMLGHGERNGRRVLSPQSVEAITSPHRVGMLDQTFRHVMDWGLGFIVNSNRYGAETVPYGFGRHASDRAFGHGGSQSSVGFADPEHGLAAAIVWNGTPGEPKHQTRVRDTLTALYEDLNLVPLC